MVAVAAEEELVNVDLPKKWLHCAVCHAALKPPVFKCKNEHAVCCACAGGGGGTDKLCGPCRRAVTFTRCRYIDGLVDDYKVACPNKKHGCERSVAYHSVAEHRLRCAHAPCYCFECTPPFEGSPADLLRHCTAPFGKHSWLTEKIKYESSHSFVVQASSEEYRCLLVAEDGCVFLLAVGAGGGPAGRRLPVNVVCVRSNTDAHTRPLYTGVLWVDGPPAASGEASR
ncbi:E3 ubiquitin-protein ligase SINA-like 3 [Hordeum vulgare subsp. vulgare]|uniref:SIAH-type domain-containing protein n=1 Tax=Hordeum vulgare subsp. vulgare TaxID=112509 RepID=A0A8I6XI79_HORVV|nr:E3 ubiquitin-protein ligase SINA-like 3 [Hordeum vulgare subsp. vulgare]